MRFLICALFGLAALVTITSGTETKEPDTVVRLEHTSHGIWTKKVIWKPRWVQSWQPKTIYISHWKKTWGPIVQKEWVPFPKPPPGWTKPAHKHEHVHHHHKIQVPVPVIGPLRTYAPDHAYVDLGHHHHNHNAPIIHHAHKPLNVINPEQLHFHAAPGAHYGPAFHHAPHHHHEIVTPHVHSDAVPHHHHHHSHPEIIGHHEHIEHPLAHEHIVNPNAETFSPHFLPLSTDHLKIK